MSGQGSEERSLFIGARAATIAGIVVGSVVIGTQFLIGRIYSGNEARDLVVAMTGSVDALSSAIISGLGTILALMLAMLSLSSRFEVRLGRPFYRRIQLIAFLSISGMILAIVLLLILGSPIQKENVHVADTGSLPVEVTYYLLVGLTALVSGLFVAIIVMLYNAIQTVIQAVRPEKEGKVKSVTSIGGDGPSPAGS